VSDTSGSSSDPKRARILEAAMAVCERRGVHAARMEEVAALARVSKGTLYRFFASKEDLFLATLIDSYEQGLRAVVEDPKAGPRERLVAAIDGLGKVLTTVAPRAAVLYQAWGVVAGEPAYESRLHDFLRDFHRDRQAEFVHTIVEGQRAGVFRSDVSAEVVAGGIGALLSGFIYRAAFDPIAASGEALRDCFDVMILDPLRAGPGPAARPTGEVGEDG
jgi:AcrR family transcriptional regulator